MTKRNCKFPTESPTFTPTGKLPNGPQFEAIGGKWSPQLHFTGLLSDYDEMAFVTMLINAYGDHLEALHCIPPHGGCCFPGTFSVEMQFQKGHEEAMRLCRQDYMHRPKNWQRFLLQPHVPHA